MTAGAGVPLNQPSAVLQVKFENKTPALMTVTPGTEAGVKPVADKVEASVLMQPAVEGAVGHTSVQIGCLHVSKQMCVYTRASQHLTWSLGRQSIAAMHIGVQQT